MITIEEYNAAEQAAIKLLPVTHEDNIWGIDPKEYAHLLHVNSFHELSPLLDRMHIPERFECFQYELGGLNIDDADRIVLAAQKVDALQGKYMRGVMHTPFSTLLSAFTIWRKIKDAKPDVESILEVGPGSGFTALYFAQDPQIKRYVSIEATQTYYLLQSMVNDEAYGDAWIEYAQGGATTTVSNKPRVAHLPWWRLNDPFADANKFDVITANACLNEMSDKALERYLNLFATKSHDRTLLLLQGLGAYIHRDDQQLYKHLIGSGWFLEHQTIDWDIEKHFKGAPHGSGMTTWWLVRNRSHPVSKLMPRSAPSITREELARLMRLI